MAKEFTGLTPAQQNERLLEHLQEAGQLPRVTLPAGSPWPIHLVQAPEETRPARYIGGRRVS